MPQTADQRRGQTEPASPKVRALLRSGDFRCLMAATFLYCCGVSGFLFLYNLMLLERGFRELSIGVLSGAALLGGLAGTVPMGLLAKRFGTRRVMLVSLSTMAAVFALKLILPSLVAQFALDVLGGICICGWTVCLAPVVAAVVAEEHRSIAFSLLYSLSVVACGLSAYLGGHLPGWYQRAALAAHHNLSSLVAKQGAMLLLSVIGGACILPLAMLRAPSRLQPRSAPGRVPGFIPRTSRQSFLFRFLVVNLLWSLAIGLFNPFTSVFVTRLAGVSLPRLGTYSSITQGVGALVVLASPWMFRRLSTGAAIVVTQLVTASCLLMLSAVHGWSAIALPLMLYSISQHVLDPNMQALLMNGTAPEEREGASGIFLLTTSLGQITAAGLAGLAITRFGYTAVLVVAACMTVAAASCAQTFFAARKHTTSLPLNSLQQLT